MPDVDDPCEFCAGTGQVCAKCDLPKARCVCDTDGEQFDPVECSMCEGTGADMLPEEEAE